jgi:hypothetical protein
MMGFSAIPCAAVSLRDKRSTCTFNKPCTCREESRLACRYDGFEILGKLSVGYPLPWNSLKYDTELGGYRTGITLQQLNEAPKYSSDSDWNWSDQTRIRSVNDYYGVRAT